MVLLKKTPIHRPPGHCVALSSRSGRGQVPVRILRQLIPSGSHSSGNTSKMWSWTLHRGSNREPAETFSGTTPNLSRGTRPECVLSSDSAHSNKPVRPGNQWCRILFREGTWLNMTELHGYRDHHMPIRRVGGGRRKNKDLKMCVWRWGEGEIKTKHHNVATYTYSKM